MSEYAYVVGPLVSYWEVLLFYNVEVSSLSANKNILVYTMIKQACLGQRSSSSMYNSLSAKLGCSCKYAYLVTYILHLYMYLTKIKMYSTFQHVDDCLIQYSFFNLNHSIIIIGKFSMHLKFEKFDMSNLWTFSVNLQTPPS